MKEKTSSQETLDNIVLKEGTFDLMLRLSEEPKSFIELKGGRISPNTVLSRLRMLQKLQLVETKLVEVNKDKRARIKYTLTGNGKKVMKRYLPIKSNYLQIRAAMSNLENQIYEQKDAIKLLLSSIKGNK